MSDAAVADLPPRFRRYSEVDEGFGTPCWVWQGSRDRNGYGRLGVGGVNCTAHRTVYELVCGRVPAGLHIDHLCRTHACMRPSHLEPVTPSENVRRGVSAAACRAIAMARTHCAQGHPFSGSNIKIGYRGERLCLECARARKRRYERKYQGRRREQARQLRDQALFQHREGSL